MATRSRLIACDTTEALLRRLDAKQMAVTLSADIEAVPGELGSFNVEHLGFVGSLCSLLRGKDRAGTGFELAVFED